MFDEIIFVGIDRKRWKYRKKNVKKKKNLNWTSLHKYPINEEKIKKKYRLVLPFSDLATQTGKKKNQRIYHTKSKQETNGLSLG